MRVSLFLVSLLSFAPSSTLSSSVCSDRDEVAVQNMMPVSNGCSKPPGLSVDGEEDFTYCCDRHDSCYQTCGMEKRFCESDFGSCMKAMCSSNFGGNPGCKGAAEMYKLGVSMFGGAPFQNMQDDSCVCTDKEKVRGVYEMWFREVYKAAGVEDAKEKAQELGGKMDGLDGGGRNFGRDTFYKLLKKYDDAIVKVDGRVRMDPPRLKKKKGKKGKGKGKGEL